MVNTVIFYAFVGWAAIQILFVLFVFRRFFEVPNFTTPLLMPRRKPVSIVICAHNEEKNLSEHLKSVLDQNYSDAQGVPLFEVIVVNDCSTDGTHNVIAGFQKQYANLREVVIAPEEHRNVVGKKYALSVGITNAQNEWLLLTDTDCQPASSEWISKMVAPLAEGKEIVAGYPAYREGQGLLNKYIRWETVHTFLQLSTFAIAGKPYLAVGRNLATLKTLYQKTITSAAWTEGPTGDDDLLVQLNATQNNFIALADPTLYTYSTPKNTYKTWKQQKQRHTSDGKNYDGKVQLWLAMYGISQAAVWVYSIYLFFTTYWALTLILLAARCVVYWAFWASIATRLKERKLLFLLPFFDIFWMLSNFAFLPYILKKSRMNWDS